MYVLTRTEAQFLLDVLCAIKQGEFYEEELDQAIELVAAIIERNSNEL